MTPSRPQEITYRNDTVRWESIREAEELMDMRIDLADPGSNTVFAVAQRLEELREEIMTLQELLAVD